MSLRRIAGETILSAIEKVAPSNVGSQLANILKLKFGDLILAQKEIRLAILDTMLQSAPLMATMEQFQQLPITPKQLLFLMDLSLK